MTTKELLKLYPNFAMRTQPEKVAPLQDKSLKFYFNSKKKLMLKRGSKAFGLQPKEVSQLKHFLNLRSL